MSLESSFPDEIMLEICRYLHPIEILLSFGGLNSRLNRTISDFIHHIQFTSVISYQNYLYLLQRILPSIWSSIQSLTINNCQVPCLSTVFLQTIENSLPPNLKKLSLFCVNLYEIYQFTTRLMEKCVVEELIIECTRMKYIEQEVYYGYKVAQMLFYHHPTLKSIELRGDIIFDIDHLSFLSLSNSEDFSSASLINLNHSFHLNRLTIALRSLSTLHLLLIYQPHLQYLNVHISDPKTTYGYTITPFPPLLNLDEFHFRSNDLAIKFENISELLTYFPNLKSLSLDLTTECNLFFDGDILQTLVQSLQLFQFSIVRFSSPTWEEQTLSTFYTPFWLERKKWLTQAYWHIDEDEIDAVCFHIYSIPYPFATFDIYKCTNENILPEENDQSFPQVKQLDFTDTSDVMVIPFLKRCPKVQIITLNDIYDDEENYGTDEEEEITDQMEENLIDQDSQLTNPSQLSLPKLSHVRYIILHALSDHDVVFFARLVCATPNLNRFSVGLYDLIEIIQQPQQTLCQILRKQIEQLEIHFDFQWLPSEIRGDTPKILRIFSNIKSLKIFFKLSQRQSPRTIKEILIQLLKHPTNLLCINIYDASSGSFESVIKQGGVELIKTWLTAYRNSVHIELKSSLMTIWF